VAPRYLGRASLVFPDPERLCISGSVGLFCRETLSVDVVRLQDPKVMARACRIEAGDEPLPVQTCDHGRNFAAVRGESESLRRAASTCHTTGSHCDREGGRLGQSVESFLKIERS
jgi:hypothetical protein